MILECSGATANSSAGTATFNSPEEEEEAAEGKRISKAKKYVPLKMGRLGGNKEENSRISTTTPYQPLRDNNNSTTSESMPDIRGYVSFSCRHCGHLQIFQETEMISLKMAFKRTDTSTPSFAESLDGSSIGIPVCNSPTRFNQMKRHSEKPSLIKRLGKGIVMTTSDEEGYPLVSDGSIPGSQSNLNHEATLRLSDLKPSPPVVSEEPQLGTNLRKAPWYQEGIPREIALEILNQEPIGAFMVRRSTTKSGCFALSVRVPRSFQPKGIAHYLIMKTSKGYRIKGFTKEFSTLAALIAHHSVMPELLPCPLSLSRYHPVCVISDCRGDFADIEPKME